MFASQRVSGLSLVQKYQLRHHFGKNSTGGKSWLGHHIATLQPVLVQAYQLPRQYQAPLLRSYQRHIAKLLELDHPRVPAYLDADTEQMSTGQLKFYTVQSFVQAKPLRFLPRATPALLKRVAQETLKVLVELQQRSTPILHGAVSPDNLWLSQDHQIYLMNFALDLDLKRPMGREAHFLAPEQRQGRALGLSTDLYSLGLTLMAWAMDLSDEDVSQILDADGNLEIQPHFSQYFSVELLNWLKTLIRPQLSARFPDAETALAALERIEAKRQPKVQIRPAALVFRANQLDEQLHQIITLENPVPDTTLVGQWEITASDRPWLRITPLRFSGNRVKCHVNVDTRHLHSDRTIERTLHLKSNAGQVDVPFRLWIKTAPFQSNHLPWLSLLLLGGLALLTSQAVAPLIHSSGHWGWGLWTAGAGLGGAMGWAIASQISRGLDRFNRSGVLSIGALTGSIGLILLALIKVPSLLKIDPAQIEAQVDSLKIDALSGLLRGWLSLGSSALTTYLLGVLAGTILCGVASHCAQQHHRRGFIWSLATAIPLLTLIVSFVMGTGHRLGGLAPSLQSGLAWLVGLLCTLVIGAEFRAFLRQGEHLWQQRRRIGAKPAEATRQAGDNMPVEGSMPEDNVPVEDNMQIGDNVNAGGRPASQVIPGER